MVRRGSTAAVVRAGNVPKLSPGQLDANQWPGAQGMEAPSATDPVPPHYVLPLDPTPESHPSEAQVRTCQT